MERIKIPYRKDDGSVEHIYREKTDKRILRKNPWKDYRLHLTVFALVVLAEIIGPFEIRITDSISFSIMPLIYAMVLGLVFYLLKPIKWIKRRQARIAEGALLNWLFLVDNLFI